MATELESELKTLVSKVIKVPEDKINPETDFFRDLKIDSLLAVEILASIDRKYGIDIPEQKVNKIRTLNDIVLVVNECISKKKL